LFTGSSAALVYDRAEDALATTQVLEYARCSCLEFRYYDGLMTRLLSEAYDSLEEKRNVLLSRWSLPRRAQRLNAIRLDVMELRAHRQRHQIRQRYLLRARVSSRGNGAWAFPIIATWWMRNCAPWADCMNLWWISLTNRDRFVLEFGILILVSMDVILLLRGR